MFYLSTPHTVAELTQYHNITFDDLFAGTVPEPTAARASYRVQITKVYEELTHLPEPAQTLMQNKAHEFVSRFRNTLMEYHGKDMHPLYYTFQIPKATGGMRTITAPEERLKRQMREVLDFLTKFLYPHQAAYAYVSTRCTKDAIEAHQRKGYTTFMKMDLHDFFGTCTPEFIKQQLLQIPFFYILHNMQQFDGISLLDKFIHFITLNGGLPQGTPLSPYITNILMLPIDNVLQIEMHKHNAFYTRYADDMLISTTSQNAAEHCKEVVKEKIVAPLSINNGKTRIGPINYKNWNLGLMLNQDRNITVGFRNKARLRAAINEFCRATTYDKQSAMELYGTIAYYLQIEPDYFNMVLTRYGQKYNMNVLQKLKAIISAQ